jgi:cytosine/adenosine deaminase-related metal-dependent hydrolase
MRTYLALAEKAREFDHDPRVAKAMAAASVPELAEPSVGPYSAGTAAQLLGETFDPDALALVGRGPEMALDRWIFAGGRDVVSDVWRRGRQVVAGGRHVARDAIAARYRRTMTKLLSD